jgi:ketol-acid reductoisomerase
MNYRFDTYITNSSKDEPNIVLRQIRSGHHNTEILQHWTTRKPTKTSKKGKAPTDTAINVQRKQDKMTNNDLQNITQKTKIDHQDPR